jgi:hypothetical protein
MAVQVEVDLTVVADHIAALRMVICDLSAVIHEIDPDGIDGRLRSVRLAVQDLEQGRTQLPFDGGLPAQRLRLQMLEQCADRTALWTSPDVE